MHSNETIDERSKSLANWVVAGIIMIVLASVLVKTFIKANSTFAEINFSVLASDYVDGLNVIRLRWLSSGKPDFLSISNKYAEKKLIILMTKGGWPEIKASINHSEIDACTELWQALLSYPLLSMKKKIKVDYLYSKSRQQAYCYYSAENTEWLSYFPNSGTVFHN